MDRASFGRFAERLAIITYRRFGFDPNEPACPIALAQRIFRHDDPIEYVTLPGINEGVLFAGEGRHIGIRRGLPLERALFVVAHELAHVVFSDAGFDDERIENACDYLGAALIAPAPAVRAIHEQYGFCPDELMLATGASATLAALRFAEVLDRPTIVVRMGETPKIRFRGGARFLPIASDHGRIFEAARGVELPGLRKVPLRDERTPRAALLVA